MSKINEVFLEIQYGIKKVKETNKAIPDECFELMKLYIKQSNVLGDLILELNKENNKLIEIVADQDFKIKELEFDIYCLNNGN